MDVKLHEQACALRTRIARVKDELRVWAAGAVCIAKRDTRNPELYRVDHFASAVAAEFWPAFASNCIRELERRLADLEQEFAEL